MAVIDIIRNTELGLSVRNKLNTILAFFNWNQVIPERSFLGRNAGSTGPTERLTAAEAKALLEIVMTDIPSLVDSLAAKANIGHTQSQSSIIDLVADLAAKAPNVDADLSGNTRADTPSSSDNSRRIATTEYVVNKFAELLGATPELLDTIEEIAAAIGNDPDFATTIMNQLSGKQGLSTVLTAMAALTLANDKMIYFTANNAAEVMDITASARALLARTSVAGLRDTLEIQHPIQTLRSVHTPKTPLTGNLTATDLNAGALHIIPQSVFDAQLEKLTYKFLFFIEAAGANTAGSISLILKYNSTNVATFTIPSGTADESYLEWIVEVSPIALSQQRIRAETKVIAPAGTATRLITPRATAAAPTNVDVNVNLTGQLSNVGDILTLTDIEIYKNGLTEIA